MTTACLNPIFFDQVEPDVNHAPVLINLTPQPTASRLQIPVGEQCGPKTFLADRLEDADRDTLTVGWLLLVDGGRRVELFGVALGPTPAEKLEENGNPYDFQPFDLGRDLIAQKLSNADLANEAGPAIEGQLLELRVSDGGFVPGSGSTQVPDGASQLFVSWAIKLVDLACN